MEKNNTGAHSSLEKVGSNFRSSYLEFSGHGHHIMIGGVVLVAVGKHQSDICRELLGIMILSAVHLALDEKEKKKKKKRF